MELVKPFSHFLRLVLSENRHYYKNYLSQLSNNLIIAQLVCFIWLKMRWSPYTIDFPAHCIQYHCCTLVLTLIDIYFRYVIIWIKHSTLSLHLFINGRQIMVTVTVKYYNDWYIGECFNFGAKNYERIWKMMQHSFIYVHKFVQNVSKIIFQRLSVNSRKGCPEIFLNFKTFFWTPCV